jgi:hypothetical protein
LSTYFRNSDRKLLGQNRTNALWDEQTDDRLLTRQTGEKSRAKEKKNTSIDKIISSDRSK